MLHIHPGECLMDEYISIKISELQPSQHITLRCEVVEGKFVYDSYAHFVASLDGVVDISSDASFGGSYLGISQMGIFWSMLPALGQMKGLRYFPRNCMKSMKFQLQVYNGHLCEESFQKSELLAPTSSHPQHPIVEGVALRKCNAEGVTREEVRHGRVRGTIFKPPGPGPFKGVIDWYGGAGGINESRVALLASHGYIAFTLPHHKYDDLVENLENVEMEYFLEAIEYFSSLSTVQPNIGILSVCTGGYIGLFMSTIYSKISAIVTYGTPYTFTLPLRYKGNTFRYIFGSVQCESLGFDDRGGYYFQDFLDHIPNDDIAIKIEESNAKFLIVAGTDDKAVNSLSNGQYLVDRMKKHGKGNQITLLSYPGAGHFIDPPFMPQTLVQYYPQLLSCSAIGGDVIPNASASVHCWKQTLDFLNRNVGVSSKL